MAEYIEREKAMLIAFKSPFFSDSLMEEIAAIPASDVSPVRHGRWEECDWIEYDGHGECIGYHKEALRCSNCANVFKKELLWKDNYCPNCGAKMDGGNDNG